MYERFTDRARTVLQLANQEAQRLNHEYIGTEHILLGLVMEGSGVAANVLKNLDVDPDRIRQEADKIVQSGPDMVTMGKLPQTPGAKRVIEYALEESQNLGHNYVGTEHLLLGTLRVTDGIGAQVLVKLGLSPEDVRDEVVTLLGGPVRESAVPRVSAMVTDFREINQLEFTDRARKVMLLAAEEAYNFGHTYLGPEHILLGVSREGTGLGVTILNEAGLTEATLRSQIKLVLAVEGGHSPVLAFQLTPLSQFVLITAAAQARMLDAEQIDADHLLLGLLKEDGGIVATVFRNLSTDRVELCEQIRQRLHTGGS